MALQEAVGSPPTLCQAKEYAMAHLLAKPPIKMALRQCTKMNGGMTKLLDELKLKLHLESPLLVTAKIGGRRPRT